MDHRTDAGSVCFYLEEPDETTPSSVGRSAAKEPKCNALGP